MVSVPPFLVLLLLPTIFSLTIYGSPEPLSPVWPTPLVRCRSSRSTVLGPPTAISLSGRFLSRPEQNCFNLLFELLFADLGNSIRTQIQDADLNPRRGLSYASRQILGFATQTNSVQLVYVGDNHPTSTSSRNRPEDKVSYMENLQQHLLNFLYIRWLQQDLSIMPCWIGTKSHQCFLILVPSRLRPEEHVSFMESLRRNKPSFNWLQEFSSLRERSLPPPSSGLERTIISSSLYSCLEDFIELQFQLLLYAMDKLLSGLETFFARTSTKFESIVRTVSTTAIMLVRSNEMHIVLYKNLQDRRKLKKHLISICFMSYYLNLSWVVCLQEIVPTILIFCCSSEA